MNNPDWQRIVDQWNHLYPVGTRVVLLRHCHPNIATTTRSHATLQPGVGPVIQLANVTGSYLLAYITPSSPQPPPIAMGGSEGGSIPERAS